MLQMLSTHVLMPTPNSQPASGGSGAQPMQEHPDPSLPLRQDTHDDAQTLPGTQATHIRSLPCTHRP
jgi:hypothetical protein